ncbi:hypothetical protein [Burkholderia vietnamiensis]|uniref:hypothetical protein n=1 Tax=Burkholderia vietnamiensis TaxID=60552 RepID=UPI001B9F90E8|nr:hypothetical protein [Burkholderia vietnamiensis]MBR8034673.1 hypothetical protein [Burkholderia vietnamiensis]
MGAETPTQFQIRPGGRIHVFDDAIGIVCQQADCQHVVDCDTLYFTYKRQILIGPLSPHDVTILTEAELPVVDPWVSSDPAPRQSVLYGVRQAPRRGPRKFDSGGRLPRCDNYSRRNIP